MSVSNHEITLDKLAVGETAEITGFGQGNEDYIKKLLSMGITRGTSVTVIRVAPLGDPMEIKVRKFQLSVRKLEASIIKVKRSA